MTKFCKEGWPDKSQIPEDVLPYWYPCDISDQNGIILFGTLLFQKLLGQVCLAKNIRDTKVLPNVESL